MATADSEQEWAQALAVQVGRNVRRLREAPERRWSAEDLAKRTAALGYEIKRPVISNLENGRRGSVTLTDLVVLAQAFGTSPMLLILPLGEEESVDLAPGRSYATSEAFDWWAGRRPLPDADWAPYWGSEGSRLLFYFFHSEHLANIAELEVELERVRDRGQPDVAQHIESELAQEKQALVNAREYIASKGWVLPDLPPGMEGPEGEPVLARLRAVQAARHARQLRGGGTP